MNTFNLHIVTPDGIAFDGDVSSIVFRASDGDVCIQANHSDYITTIDISEIKIITEFETKHAACTSGFFTISKNKASLIATTFEFAESIDLARAKDAKKRAEELLNEKKSNLNLSVVEAKLKRALLRINVAEK